MFKPVRAGGWVLTIPKAAGMGHAARGRNDYWFLDRRQHVQDGQQRAAMIIEGAS
jgi:hypothetical protein